MNARAKKILERFPAHLEAAREGKRLGEVASALSLDLELLNSSLAAVRRSRRLADAGEAVDLLRIGALHGVTSRELAILFARRDAGRALLDSADAAAPQALIGLWAIQDSGPPLDRYADAKALFEFARRALNNAAILNQVRRRLGEICAIHARGNGTVRALIYGAANALDLNVLATADSEDRYLHTARVQDRLRLQYAVDREFTPAVEHILIEENPLTGATSGKNPRKHAELFSVLRRGFERATIRVLVEGLQERTVGPMFVNRDEGHGIGYSGAVPAGDSVTFTEEGRVLLGSQDVTANSYAWKGACFGAETESHPSNFVFAGADHAAAASTRTAVFAQSAPLKSLQSGFVFPHSGESLPMPGLSVGETRFAFFVQEAHFSREATPVERVAPRPGAGFANQSVFAPGPSEERQPAAQLTLEWQERKAFWVNVWIPERFRKWTPDDAEGRATRDAVEAAVNRFRPAGVRVNVEFQDNRWTLGRGVLPDPFKITNLPVAPGSGSDLW